MAKLGKAFSDGVILWKNKRKLPSTRDFRGWGVRLTLLYLLLIILVFTLVLRLFHLMVIKGAENLQLSEGNRIQTSIIHAPRGIFYDRKGVALVKNIPGLRVSFPCDQNNFCSPTFLTEDNWKKQKEKTPDVFYELDFLREYLFPIELAHVLGYLSEISSEELNNPYYKYQDYLYGDRIGRLGLEAAWEKKLRGIDGKELVEINAQGKRLRTLGKVEAIPGQNFNLSIDADLQKVAYDAMEDKIGAIVVSKPKTGEILAIVSKPSFDANKFNSGISEKDYQDLVKDQNKPLFDRAVSGVYPPGSTFKIIVATAGLETGKITKNTIIEDTGILKIGDFSFANWYFTQYGKTDGNVDILKALARSNDIYFYKLGETVGISELAKWGKIFGIGKKLGIEVSGEAEGVMPDPTWRKMVRGDEWYLGDTYHVSIGQGDLQTTPLQVNTWTNAIAGNGMFCKPTLVKFAPNQFFDRLISNNCIDLKLKKETIETITEGMRRACSSGSDISYEGTGYPFFDFTVTKEIFQNEEGKAIIKKVPVACKTGTAEFASNDINEPTHAWFTAFAPMPAAVLTKEGGANNIISGDPEITVTVLVEKGGEGSTVAAPIAKEIMESWFGR